jgi:hypothetical protein
MIFARFRELGSARQVHLSIRADQLHFPRPSDGKRMINLEWTSIGYRNVISVLKNPFYAASVLPSTVLAPVPETIKYRAAADRWCGGFEGIRAGNVTRVRLRS